MSDPTPENEAEPHDGDDAGLPGAEVVAASRVARFLSAAGFEVGLVAFGITAAAFSMGARLDDPGTWGHDEFFGTLGFGALLAVLGCVERWLWSLRQGNAADV